MRRFYFSFTLSLSLGLAAAACTSNSGTTADGGSPDAGCALYQVPSGTNLLAPTVSFANDVMPIMKASCGLSSSCHGSPTGSRIFLGSNATLTDPAKVRAAIVGVPSTDLPTMPFITASDPGKSFLLHKMDGDQCTFQSQCVSKDCGESMPQGSDVLEVAKRDVVRRWIAQGAVDN